MDSLNFTKNSEKALKDQNLRKALVNSTNKFRSARKNAVDIIDNWQELRNEARSIKKHTIDNLDKYLLELEESIKRVGGEVHWAKNAEEANKIIINIALRNGVKKVVKSKSMATEEVELNKAFNKYNIDSVETDLGEYILQLSEEHPSHIIAPAIHKSKDTISKLFADKFDIPEYDDPADITKFARAKLREEFLSAQMGVSGVNFAVAETGTIAIVENEGNARLTTTLPKIHVALMGIEKIIPKFKHLSIFLSLLARSATGQKSSTYVSFLTGPKREKDKDGPKQFHLVLLDNGRTDILANEETKESLYCIRCGACLNICPVYRQVGGHSYGWVYSGPIGAVITPQLLGIEKAHQLPFASSLCGACKDVCPVKIDFPKVLLDLRQQVKKSEITSDHLENKFEKYSFKLWKSLVKNHHIYNFASRAAYYLGLPLARSNSSFNKLPGPLSNWTKDRDFPALAKVPFRRRWKRLKRINSIMTKDSKK